MQQLPVLCSLSALRSDPCKKGLRVSPYGVSLSITNNSKGNSKLHCFVLQVVPNKQTLGHTSAGTASNPFPFSWHCKHVASTFLIRTAWVHWGIKKIIIKCTCLLQVTLADNSESWWIPRSSLGERAEFEPWGVCRTEHSRAPVHTASGTDGSTQNNSNYKIIVATHKSNHQTTFLEVSILPCYKSKFKKVQQYLKCVPQASPHCCFTHLQRSLYSECLQMATATGHL